MFNRIPIIIIIFIITIIGVPLGIIWPSVRQIRSISQGIYSQYQFLEEKNQRGFSIKQAKKEYDDLSDKFPLIQSLAIENGQELKFITSLEKLADENNVTEKIMLDVQSRKLSGNYDVLPVELIIQGSYRDIIKYMAALRTIPATMSLTSLSISSGRAIDSPRRNSSVPSRSLEARLSGIVYAQPIK